MRNILPDDIQPFIFCACTHTNTDVYICTYTGTLFDIMHHSTLRPLHMMANCTAIIINPICCEWNSHLSAQYIAVNIRFSLTTFKESAGSGFLWLADMNKHVVQCTSNFC
jgi:hypothetical protein